MKIRRWSDVQLSQAIADSVSLRQVAKKLGLKPSGGGTYYSLRNHILRLKIDISHFKGQGANAGKILKTNPQTLKQLLVISTKFMTSTHSFKLRLIKAKMLEAKCNSCGIQNWLNKSLSLHLDHVNGNRMDNRLQNLQLLCPNCHSQTSTYCGKNIKFVLTNKCRSCGKLIKQNRAHCQTCFQAKAYKQYKR